MRAWLAFVVLAAPLAGCTLDRTPSTRVSVSLDLKALQSATASKPGVLAQKPTLAGFKCLILRARGPGIQTPGAPGKNCDPMQWGLFTPPQSNPLFGQSPGVANSEISFTLPVNEGDDRFVELVGYNPHDGGACASWNQRILPSRRDEFLRDAYVIATSGRISVRASQTIELESVYDSANTAQPRACGPYLVPQSGTTIPRRIADAGQTAIDAGLYCSHDGESVALSFNGSAVGSPTTCSNGGIAILQVLLAANTPAADGLYFWQFQHGAFNFPAPLLVDRTKPSSSLPQLTGQQNPFTGNIDGLGPGISFGIKFEDINGVKLSAAAQTLVSAAVTAGSDPALALGSSYISLINNSNLPHGCTLRLNHVAGGPGSNNPNMMGFRGTATNCSAAGGTAFQVSVSSGLVQDIGPDPAVFTTNIARAITTAGQPFQVPGNTPPTLTGFATFSGLEDTALTITHGMLLANAQGLGDAETPTANLSFKVISLGNGGTLTKPGGGAVAVNDLIGPSDSVIFVPNANEGSASANAFGAKAYDGAATSSAAYGVNVNVAHVNDPPIFSVTSSGSPVDSRTIQMGFLSSVTISNILPGPATATDEANQTVNFTYSGASAFVSALAGPLTSGSRTLTLTPLAPGSATLTITGTDSHSTDPRHLAVTLAITVTAGVPNLSYAGATGTSGTVNSPMSITPSLQTNGATLTSCAIKAGTTPLPSGLSVNATTCVISGTPTTASAQANYTIVATNSAGPSANAVVSITVAAASSFIYTWKATATTGAWNSGSNWTRSDGATPTQGPGSNDDVVIQAVNQGSQPPTLTLTGTSYTAKAKSITLNNNAMLNLSAQGTSAPAYTQDLAGSLIVPSGAVGSLNFSGFTGELRITGQTGKIEVGDGATLKVGTSGASNTHNCSATYQHTLSLPQGGEVKFANSSGAGGAAAPTASKILLVTSCVKLQLVGSKITVTAPAATPEGTGEIGILGRGTLALEGANVELQGAVPATVSIKAGSSANDTARGQVTLKGPTLSRFESKVLANISAGTDFSCAISFPHQNLWCWGKNGDGQLGVYNQTTQYKPNQVIVNTTPPVTQFIQVSAGVLHTCAIAVSATPGEGPLYCWGNGGNGRLGNSNTTGSTSPTLINSNTSYKRVSAGDTHTCAITGAGVLHCWGQGTNHRLGQGSSTTQQNAPVVVDSGVTYQDVSAGNQYTCGVTTTKALKCWGTLDGSTMIQSPTALDTAESYEKVSMSKSSTGANCGITSANKLKCWGSSNANGQLGTGNTSTFTTPQLIDSTTNYTSVTAGDTTTCGVTSANILKCWGLNKFTAGTVPNTYTVQKFGVYTQNNTSNGPVVLAGEDQVIGGSMGLDHGCLVAKTGTSSTEGALKCWGLGTNGQLGFGSEIHVLNSPGRVTVSDETREFRLGAYASLSMDTQKLRVDGSFIAASQSSLTDNQTTSPVTLLYLDGGVGSRARFNGTLTVKQIEAKTDRIEFGSSFSNGNSSQTTFKAYPPPSAVRPFSTVFGQGIYSDLPVNGVTKLSSIHVMRLSGYGTSSYNAIYYRPTPANNYGELAVDYYLTETPLAGNPVTTTTQSGNWNASPNGPTTD